MIFGNTSHRSCLYVMEETMGKKKNNIPGRSTNAPTADVNKTNPKSKTTTVTDQGVNDAKEWVDENQL